MRSYETGLSYKIYASVIVALVITTGVFIVALNLPGNGGNNTTTTPTTTTTTTGGLGSRVAFYLNSMRDNVVFYWMCNSTFVNQNLTEYYDVQHPGAYVIGLYMTDNETGGEINVIFAPYPEVIVGKGSLTETEWNGLSGSIIDDGLGQMVEATNPPAGDWPHTFPIEIYMTVYFNDSTCFFFGYTKADRLVYIVNGTWSGDFNGADEPWWTSMGTGYWLDENGHFDIPLQNLFTAITTNVDYP